MVPASSIRIALCQYQVTAHFVKLGYMKPLAGTAVTKLQFFNAVAGQLCFLMKLESLGQNTTVVAEGSTSS